MRTRSLAVVLAAVPLALAGLGMGGADARPAARPSSRSAVVLHRADPRGDVVLTSAAGLGRRDREGVDLRALTITRHRGVIRLTMRVRRVAVRPDFTQIYLVNLDEPHDADPITQLEVATHSEQYPPTKDGLMHDIILDGTRGGDDSVECDDLRTSLRDGATRWWVDLPRRCVPAGRLHVSVYAQTVGRGAADKQFSHDRLAVPGRTDLGGRVHGDGRNLEGRPA